MNHLPQMLIRSLVILWFVTVSAWAVVNIDPPTRSFTRDGGGGSILTSGTGTWSASTTAPWITITPRTSGNVGETCIYVVGANLSADTRQGAIQITDKTHTVTQLGYPATLSPTSATVDLTGGTRTVGISTSAGVSWTAVSTVPWVTVNTPSGIGNGSVSYTVAAYSGVTTRTGSLIIGSQTFTISQTGRDVNIVPYSVEKAYSSDIVMVQVSALSSTSWAVKSNASWISVVDAGNGFGDSTVTLGISTNPSFLERNGTVQIGSATFSIRQAGTPSPIIDILPKEATAEPTGAYGNIAVLATPDAPWTAESLSPWIILSGAAGAGNGNIGYVASANPTLTPRTGAVRVYAPAVLPKVDLTLALLAHIPTGSTDVSGWMRHPTGAIEARLDGSFRRELTGQDILVDQDAGSLALRFKVENSGAVHRLFGLNANSRNTALYINANDKLVFHSGSSVLVSDFTVEANKDYHVVVTASASRAVRLYAGEVGGTIRLAGSSTFADAPLRLSVATPAATVKIGYADLPSSGYLNGGVLKDFRLYGRALNSDEVSALFAAALTAAPYGPVEVPAINPVVSYNMRGQAAVTGGSLAPTGAAKSHMLMAAITSGLSTSWKEIHQSTFNDAFPLALEIPVTSTVVSGTPVNTVSYGGSQIVYVRVGLTYEDNTTITLAEQSVMASRGNTSTRSTTSVDQTLTFTNPHAEKRIKSANVSAYYARAISGGVPGPSFEPSFSYSVGVMASVVASVPVAISGSIGWNEVQDRFSAPQRALESSGTGELRLWSHQSSFSGNNATYSLWLRCESLPPAGTRWRLFKRAGLLSHLLTAELDFAGNIHCSNGTQSASFNAGIKAQQWQMLTFTGAYGANLTAFVDGSEVGNTNVFSTYNYGRANDDSVWMRIGGWSGSLGNVAFYNGALTSAQVKTIYDAERVKFLDHIVVQGVVDPGISPVTASLPAAGGLVSTQLTLASNVNWTASSSAGWLQITSGTSGAGSAVIQVFAEANPGVTARTAEVTIAGRVFTVTQAGLPADVSYSPTVFTTDGGSVWVDVTAGGNAQWSATSDVSWLTVALGQTGAGTGSVFIVADPYNDTSRSRTGTVTVAGQTIYFTQRGYNLSISPQVAQIGSNAGAGEFGVAAPLSAIWEAIVTQPWITLSGSTTGIGNGTLRYTVAANTTGQTRTGKIVVSGTEYTITQLASLLLTAESDGNGSVSGGGSYQTNATAVLTATPSAGYVFSHWTGDAVGSANPLNLSMDSGKTVKANFVPQSAAMNTAASLGLVQRQTVLNEVASNPNAFGFYTHDQIQGLALGKPLLSRDIATGKMTLTLRVKHSTDLLGWTDLPVVAGEVSVQGGQLNIQITPEGNAAFYILEGK